MCWQVGLIVGLLVGTVAVGTFVGLQIGQEGRTAVLAVTEALPTWSLKLGNETTALAKQALFPDHFFLSMRCTRMPCMWPLHLAEASSEGAAEDELDGMNVV